MARTPGHAGALNGSAPPSVEQALQRVGIVHHNDAALDPEPTAALERLQAAGHDLERGPEIEGDPLLSGREPAVPLGTRKNDRAVEQVGGPKRVSMAGNCTASSNSPNAGTTPPPSGL